MKIHVYSEIAFFAFVDSIAERQKYFKSLKRVIYFSAIPVNFILEIVFKNRKICDNEGYRERRVSCKPYYKCINYQNCPIVLHISHLFSRIKQHLMTSPIICTFIQQGIR